MQRSQASSTRRRIVYVAVAGLVLGTASSAGAGIVVSVQSVSANRGTTGNTLEVDVQNTGASVDIASFSFEISVPVSSGVSFSGADTNTSTASYIFAGNSGFGPNIATATGTTLDASDLAVVGSTTLGTGATLALGRVIFDVASSAPLGQVTVSLTGFPATSLTDPNLGNIVIDTLNNGTIDVTSGGVVPEPTSIVSATLGLFGGALLIWRARRTARRAQGLCNGSRLR
jgi:hypothetical protein